MEKHRSENEDIELLNADAHIHGEDCHGKDIHEESGRMHESHGHAHGEKCECGHSHGHDHKDHDHGHGGACACGQSHEGHDHSHGEESVCGHGLKDSGHVHGEGCSCNHDHEEHGHSHGHGCACCDDTPIKIDSNQKVWQIDKRQTIGIIISILFLIAGLVVDKVVGKKLFGLYLAFYIIAFIAVAYDSMYEGFKGLIHKDIFNENTLMNVAAIGAFCIGEFEEGVMVMLLYTIGETIQGISVRKSKKSIGELLDIKVEKSNLLNPDGSTVSVDTSSLKVGDKVVVKVGEKVPVDGRIVDGASSFDYSKLTGESIPAGKGVGDEVLGGTINLDSVITLETLKEEKDATAAKILKLVEESQQNKPQAEKFIRKFAKIYTPIVFALALIISVFLPLVSQVTYVDAIRKGLVFLVISCPCALVISTPLTYFSGIGSASRKGVLVKGGNYLEILDGIEEVCFDKTGTLTEGKLEVKNVYSQDEELLLKIAGACEDMSSHPIARCISQYCKSQTVATDAKEIAGKGVVCEVDGKIAVCGSAALLNDNGIDGFERAEGAYSAVYVGYDGKYLGRFEIADRIRENSKSVIKDLKDRGISATMLTGDNSAVAEAVGKELGIDTVKASLMPQDKCDYVKSRVADGKKVMFVGDGLNDAPAIKNATLGVCVSGMGNDASVEASDMVLIGGNIDRLGDAFKVAKKTKRVIIQNIAMALGVKFAIMIVCMFVNPLMWLAVVADVGVCLLAVINSMSALRGEKRK